MAKKTISKHTKRLIFLIVFLLAGASAGYALLSQTININGTAKYGGSDTTWNVKIDTATLSSSSVGTTEVSHSLDSSQTTFTYVVKLTEPGAKAVYEVTIKNAGTISATLSNITKGTSTSDNNVKYTITDENNLVYLNESGVYSLPQGQTADLLAGASKKFLVVAAWNTDTIPATETSVTFSATFNYAQKL